MIEFNNKSDQAKVLLITPLLEHHKISSNTFNSVLKNKINFDWIQFKGDNNPYKNVELALKEYKKEYKLPDYILKIDNDLILKPNMIDKMYKVLSKSKNNIGYVYCSFSFKGILNCSFEADKFNVERLKEQNYISSISMIKLEALNKIGGFVTDDKYFRLLDWALWLKFLKNNYIGKPILDTSFIAISEKNTVSSKSYSDYILKYNRVKRDFI